MYSLQEVCRNSDGYREVDLFTVSPDGSLCSVAHRLIQIGLAARSGGLRFRFRLVLYFALSSRCTGCYSGIWGEPCNDAGYEIIPLHWAYILRPDPLVLCTLEAQEGTT